MRILYYLTAHGYGHAVRACAICREFSPGVQVLFRTLIPRKFFEEEIEGSFGYFPERFDCGCIQSDSVTVDQPKTLRTYMRLAEQNRARQERETNWVLQTGVDGIVSDIVPFAFEVAKEAGIPSVAVSNFSWYDIYEPYVMEYPAFRPYLQAIRRQYEMAAKLLELVPSTGMPYFRNRMEVPLVGGVGRCLRDQLGDRLGLDKKRHLALIYLGEFGMEGISWKNLSKLDDWDFLGIYPLPFSPGNYHLVKKEDFTYLDLVASVDVMVSKIGYGTFSQSLMHGTPLIYLPRDGFAEFPVLEKAMVEWGHGYRLEQKDYRALRWKEALRRVITRTRPEPKISEGARICAREIERVIRR